jgi:hypothetical protein
VTKFKGLLEATGIHRPNSEEEGMRLARSGQSF